MSVIDASRFLSIRDVLGEGMNIHEDEHARGGIEEGGSQLTHPSSLNIDAAEEQDQLLHPEVDSDVHPFDGIVHGTEEEQYKDPARRAVAQTVFFVHIKSLFQVIDSYMQ
ncbi:unnamed protein product [Miscanthus lutarioriparius]|uniref:Uncharacterized protein n=1 Tax=Miscanthus lutarioriparius TaxID=422564 RepID=A0A811RL08_9POAL|nr:unnamed protein product [Miscanthus lutarioriparius]